MLSCPYRIDHIVIGFSQCVPEGRHLESSGDAGSHQRRFPEIISRSERGAELAAERAVVVVPGADVDAEIAFSPFEIGEGRDGIDMDDGLVIDKLGEVRLDRSRTRTVS